MLGRYQDRGRSLGYGFARIEGAVHVVAAQGREKPSLLNVSRINDDAGDDVVRRCVQEGAVGRSSHFGQGQGDHAVSPGNEVRRLWGT